MANPLKTGKVTRLEGSRLISGEHSVKLGTAALQDIVSFTIMVRRRTDGPPLPDPSYGQDTHPSQRTSYSIDEFAKLFGASEKDLDAVSAFLTGAGMSVVESNAARRTVIGRGTVEQVNAAFAITLSRYDSPAPPSRKLGAASGQLEMARRQVHRGYDGTLQVPKALGPVIVGVYGLDDRKVSMRSSSPGARMVTVPQVLKLYGWPSPTTPPAGLSNQVIGIIAEEGVDPADIADYYKNLNVSLYDAGFFYKVNGSQSDPAQQATSVSPSAIAGSLAVPSIQFSTAAGLLPNTAQSGDELTMDISVASTVAQGAQIEVYCHDGTVNGWIAALNAAIFPAAGEPVPNVITCSWIIWGGDDTSATWAPGGVTPNDIHNIDDVLKGATILQNPVTVCVASGDSGTFGGLNDGHVHAFYPSSDPYVLSCGGTTIANISLGSIGQYQNSFDEYIWNDNGASGGGISAFFPLPSWQNAVGVPPSLNPAHATGRGLPDVSANSSPYSGYVVFSNGYWIQEGGTSAAAPLIAGLIAVANATIGHNVGFLNPLLYTSNPPGLACRRVRGGALPIPSSNEYFGLPGYPATGPGWNACTGWGVFDWNKLITVLTKAKEKEKEKLKEHKDFEKAPKEKESEGEKLHPDKAIYTKQEIGSDKQTLSKNEFGEVAGLHSSHSERLLRTILLEQSLDVAKLAQGVESLGHEVHELRAFIQPKERPPSGEGALARSAQAAKRAGTGKAKGGRKKA